MRDDKPVPVLMYHTVGITDRRWQWPHLTCPYRRFEEQMRWLHGAGFVTVGLEDLYDYVFNGKLLPGRSVVLTFDDGYVDNWVFAVPIMKKYGFKGTVFVSPEFVDKRDIVRDRLGDTKAAELEKSGTEGYLSWPEMRKAEAEGVLDIQAHAMTHTWYPVSDRIVDFRSPGDPYIWMTRNQHVDRKPYLQIDDPKLVRYGEPVYEHAKSLSARRFYPDPRLADRLAEYVEEEGGKKFFEREGWREALFRRAEEVVKEIEPKGRIESEGEYRQRVRAELSDTKSVIERELEKKVDFLCWPGGSGTDTGITLAEELGYKMTTTARDLSPEKRDSLANLPSQGSNRIARVTTMLYWDGKEDRNSRFVYDSGFTLVLRMLQYKKMWLAHTWGRLIRKVLKEIMGAF